MEDNGKLSKIYLDYNATTPLADEVLDAMHRSMVCDWGNPSSTHVYGCHAKGAINKARHQLAQLLRRPADEITFTSGGTEANNMVIHSTIPYFEEFKTAKNQFHMKIPHVVTSNVEHDSIINPLQHLASRFLLEYTSVKVNKNGCINVEDVLKNIKDNTCLVTVMAANNETGVIMPISELGEALIRLNVQRKEDGKPYIMFHTDAAQFLGKETVYANDLHVDCMTIVGHKFYGPRIGCIWARLQLYPLLHGGGQESGMRPGTENTPMIVGLGQAGTLVTNNLHEYRLDMLAARNHLEERLMKEFGDKVVINCKSSNRLVNTSSISFVERGLTGRKVLSRCRRIIAGVGAACHGTSCSQVLLNSGVPLELAENTIRLSVGRNTTLQDIDLVIEDLKQAVDKNGRTGPSEDAPL